jgi:hypothetical protein
VDGKHPAGGSRELAYLIDEYGEILLPELKHYYGIDLRDLFRESWPLTPRFVLAHIANLPVGSAFNAARRGGQQFRGWDEDRYMTATLINSIRVLTHVLVMVNIDPKKSKPKPPDPYPTPDDLKVQKPAPKPGSFAHTTMSLLAKAKKRKEGG